MSTKKSPASSGKKWRAKRPSNQLTSKARTAADLLWKERITQLISRVDAVEEFLFGTTTSGGRSKINRSDAGTDVDEPVEETLKG